MRNCDDICPRLESDVSIEAATKRVFVVGDKFILSDLKELTKTFGLRCNFIPYRTGAIFRCNRAYRKDREKLGLRQITSIKCGCEWSIRFVGYMKNQIKN